MNAQHMAYVERDYAYVIKPILDLTVVSNAQDTANFMRTNAFVMRALQERTVNKPRFAKKDAKKNGVCRLGKCLCNAGFDGPDCAKLLVCPGACNKQGQCRLGKCYCNFGFAEPDCKKPGVCPNDCSKHGLCRSGKCFCDDGFEGDDCNHVPGEGEEEEGNGEEEGGPAPAP